MDQLFEDDELGYALYSGHENIQLGWAPKRGLHDVGDKNKAKLMTYKEFKRVFAPQGYTFEPREPKVLYDSAVGSEKPSFTPMYTAETLGIVWKSIGSIIRITHYMTLGGTTTMLRSSAGEFPYAVYLSTYEELGYSFTRTKDLGTDMDVSPSDDENFWL